MNPKHRSAVFLGAAFALMVPYFAFVVYFSLRLPQNHWPNWFTNTIALWFVANFLALMFLSRKLRKEKAVVELQSVPPLSTKATLGVWFMRIFGSYLVLLWSVLFVIGLKGTVQGKYEISRSIPAGAFLLLFIGIFGWGIYRSFQRKI